MAVSFTSIIRTRAYWPRVQPGCLPMDRACFEALDRHPGWKYEYMKGAAVIRPSHGAVGTARSVRPLSEAYGPWTVEPVRAGDDEALRSLYEQLQKVEQQADHAL